MLILLRNQIVAAVVVISGASAFGSLLTLAQTYGLTPLGLVLLALIAGFIDYIMRSAQWPAAPEELLPAPAWGAPLHGDGGSTTSILDGTILAAVRWGEILGISEHATEDTDARPAPEPPKTPTEAIAVAIRVSAIVVATVCMALAVVMSFKTVLVSYNLTFSVVVVTSILAGAVLNRAFLEHQNWKSLKDDWLVFPVMPSLANAGLATLNVSETAGVIVRSGIRFSQVTVETLGALYALALFFWVVAAFLQLIGRSRMQSETTRIPLLLFTLTLAFALLANATMFCLLLDGFLLTACAYFIS